ncbi:hypothetical protein [Nocardia crassostreae]|uniref:hypothetical protein n=1 Tax=Nocardia crassostreae TaxID=53428 RepID=UPI00082F02B3|nr:hypothetical protein [Nocardia crassostreae]
MPATLVLAAILQGLLATLMFVIPITVWFTGAKAQLAAESEVIRQGHTPDVLARHGIRFKEEPWEFAFAIAVGSTLIALVALNLTGTARLISLIGTALILLVVGFITTSQVFAVQYTRAAFARSSDPAARTIDVPPVLAAAKQGFPSWLRLLIPARFLLATLGSLTVLIVLLTPAATAYFA